MTHVDDLDMTSTDYWTAPRRGECEVETSERMALCAARKRSMLDVLRQVEQTRTVEK